ncbi:MAG: sel1 repeat family protein [Gammaproteobacteria bacterium]|nr:sel1 repeat family protein [Gammaproteobacteria bacterium]
MDGWLCPALFKYFDSAPDNIYVQFKQKNVSPMHNRKNMKYLMLIIFFWLVQPVYAKEDCSLSGIELEEESNDAVKLYYTGTCHYRNKDYQMAAKQWKQLSQLNNVPREYEELQINVLNNLGYLMFFGYGVEKKQFEAVDYWQKAVSLGHTESEYHLCHAYADTKESTYNKLKAKQHCSKALLIYNGLEEKDDEILRQIKKYNNQVNE